MPELNDLLTPLEAANYLRMPVRTLASLRFQKKGPQYLRLTPRTIRYERSALDAFRSASKQSAAAGAA